MDMDEGSEIDLLLEDTAQASAALMLRKVNAFIEKRRTGSERIPVQNPSTGQVIGDIPNEGAKGVTDSIERAQKALPNWASRLPRERAVIMMRWHRLIVENSDGLAALMTLEQGKPVADAKGEIAYAAKGDCFSSPPFWPMSPPK